VDLKEISGSVWVLSIIAGLLI